jgi:small redox-active disulfide protein 2
MFCLAGIGGQLSGFVQSARGVPEMVAVDGCSVGCCKVILEKKVLGPGCKKCHETEKLVREIVSKAASDATVEYITDLAEIAKQGIFRTPAVVIDGKVKSLGKVLSKAEVEKLAGEIT